jgi:beta-phosphoglucomutase-like phosphatase (HAD superfamily)
VIANSEPLHFAAFRDVLEQAGIAFTEQESRI